MSVINNTCSEVGDILLIEATSIIVGLISLDSYTDILVGETTTRYFKKEFKYSLDGINFTTYQNLTDANLQAISIQSTDTFFIYYRYTRIGTDSTGLLEFDSVTVNGQFQEVSCGPIFNKSIFAEYIKCETGLDWCINVFGKVYEKGIVPNYITRGEEQSTTVDRDYIDFWRTISCFFSIFVNYARVFESFKTQETMLFEFLKQRNLFNCRTTSQQDLLYILSNYYDEIRQRGTIQIATESSTDKEVDGELLRLICYIHTDEFIFNLIKENKFGWNIDNASPLYRGMSDQISVNKAYEDSTDIVNLSKYPLIEPSYIYREHDWGNDKWVLEIKNVPLLGKSGISPDNPDFSLVDFTKAIKVDPSLDYEITFWIKQPIKDDSDSDSESDWGSWIGSNSKISFRCYGFDINNNPITLQEISLGVNTNTFFEGENLNQDGVYYFVRGIIFNKDETLRGATAEFLNIGFGQNLRFSSEEVVKIIPEIVLENPTTAVNNLYIWDVKVKPLATPFSTGFIQTNNFIEIWMKNRNEEKDRREIEEVQRRYLLPYNSTFKNIYINKLCT